MQVVHVGTQHVPLRKPNRFFSETHGEEASSNGASPASDEGGSVWGWVMIAAIFAAMMIFFFTAFNNKVVDKGYGAELPSINTAKSAFTGKDTATCKALSKEYYNGRFLDDWWINFSCDEKSGFTSDSFRAHVNENQFLEVHEGSMYNLHVVDWGKKPNLPKFSFTPR